MILIELSSRETDRLLSIVDNIDYSIFAYIKRGMQISFRTIENFEEKFNYKMLLLVPKELRKKYLAYCEGT